MQESSQPKGLHRRDFIARGALAAATPAAAAGLIYDGAEAASAAPLPDPRTPMPMKLRINGADRQVALDPRTTLLDAMRDHLGLTGSKKGCDHGQCGACTVHLDGRRTLSCLTLAVMAQGHEITTIEGIAGADGALHPMQQAFVENDAFQCGYCTPGQIMSGIGCVTEGRMGSDAEIREYMSGNICRCSAYPNIVAAVKQAAATMKA